MRVVRQKEIISCSSPVLAMGHHFQEDGQCLHIYLLCMHGQWPPHQSSCNSSIIDVGDMLLKLPTDSGLTACLPKPPSLAFATAPGASSLLIKAAFSWWHWLDRCSLWIALVRLRFHIDIDHGSGSTPQIKKEPSHARRLFWPRDIISKKIGM